MLRLRDGGWVLLVGAALIAAVVAWRAPYLLAGLDSRAVGDGSDPASYGFDLSDLRVPPDTVLASGMPRDGLQALDHPPPASVAEIDAIPWGGHGHGTMLVPSDRVIGVASGGEARAYPLGLLNWHEVVVDTVGDRPIVVAYHPLADTAAVLDRRVDGRPLSFGFSGLLHQSCALLYDRPAAVDGDAAAAADHDASLWSAPLGEAIAGPRAGTQLAAVPFALVRWADWLARHPDTTVMAPDLDRKRVYKRKPYESYRGSDRLRFPVDPQPPDDGLARKTPLVGVRQGGEVAGYPLDWLRDRAGDDGRWQTELGGLPLTFEVGPLPTVFVTPADDDARVVHAYRFAWHALFPDAPLRPRPGRGEASP